MAGQLTRRPGPVGVADGQLTPLLLWLRVGGSADTGTVVRWDPAARTVRYRRTYLDPEASFAAGSLVLRTVSAAMRPSADGWWQFWQDLEGQAWERSAPGRSRGRDGPGWEVQAWHGPRRWAARGEVGSPDFEPWRRAVRRLIGGRVP
ncbi:MAG: hypothetical protein M3276_09845 [Actinomycetota bacterium]|nr:hypothetical protein [Actinomycetota bacterium]